MYIKRILEADILEGAQYFPVIAILGPRQSGKTTLAKKLFSQHVYVSLEEIDVRKAAIEDPRTFLSFFPSEYGLIIDEFQYAPNLLSYIQTIVDRDKRKGYFILTGSQNFLMNEAISQSLAGRISLHTLLPLSIEELKEGGLLSNQVEELMYKGCYPAIYNHQIPSERLYAQYIKTYVERDVRQLSHVGDLSTFQTFLALCADRVGQLVNFNELARDCRISDNTVKRWLSILESSYIIYLLRPYEKSFGKRLIKRAKIYFYDPGIVCYLLKIKEEELLSYPKRGSIFESLIIIDIIKGFYNKGKEPSIYFWQDSNKHEIDCLIKYSKHLIAIEIKSSRTINPNFFSGLTYWKNLNSGNEKSECYVVYADVPERITGYKEVVSWQSVNEILSFLTIKIGKSQK